MNKIVLKDYSLLLNDEHEKLLKIRNKEYIREVSLDTNIIEFVNHISFVKSLKKSDRRFWAIFHNDVIVGGVNIFNISSDLKWGIFFEESTSLIVKSIVPIIFLDFVFANYKNDEIYLEVKKENINTIAYDKNLGFEIYKEDDKIIYMKMDKQRFEIAKEKAFLKRVIKQIKKFDVEIV